MIPKEIRNTEIVQCFVIAGEQTDAMKVSLYRLEPGDPKRGHVESALKSDKKKDVYSLSDEIDVNSVFNRAEDTKFKAMKDRWASA